MPTPTEAAQMMIDAVRCGARSLAFMEESLLIAKAKIDQGEGLAPFTCEELGQIVALVEAALFPPAAPFNAAAELARQTPAVQPPPGRSAAPGGKDDGPICV